jgi:hypothetical protein
MCIFFNRNNDQTNGLLLALPVVTAIIFAVLPREINPLFNGLGWLISPLAGTRIPFELVDPQH